MSDAADSAAGITEPGASPETAASERRYGYYALVILLLVNVFILIDRQLLAVLAQDIKLDLGLTDAQIGFIYGTAISVFYAVFSIPLGRFADVWIRKRMLAICIGAWSLMIVLTGSARNMLSFAIFRAGVGVGEAGAGPPALSMIADYFPPRLRSTAMSIFASGVALGGGAGLFLGGHIADAWNAAYPHASQAPLGLHGWQVAFFVVAIPGPLLAVWVATLKEPIRGSSEGLVTAMHPHPFREVWEEMRSTLPIVSLIKMRQLGGGAATFWVNLGLALGIGGAAAGLIRLTGSVAQWVALGGGIYCVVCWAQTLRLRDPATFGMLFKCPSMVFTNLGVAGYVFVIAGFGAWIVPFMIRVFHVSAGNAGLVVGILVSGGGFIGNVTGGFVSDILERRTPRARIYMLLSSLVITLPFMVLMLYASSAVHAYIYVAVFCFTSTTWYGIAPAVVNSIVMPRMRGIASALYLITFTLFGVALGPYFMGYVSDLFTKQGLASGPALRMGILWGLTVSVITFVVLGIAAFYLPRDDANRLERARALGESIEEL